MPRTIDETMIRASAAIRFPSDRAGRSLSFASGVVTKTKRAGQLFMEVGAQRTRS